MSLSREAIVDFARPAILQWYGGDPVSAAWLQVSTERGKSCPHTQVHACVRACGSGAHICL